jgi:hypothetical protein
MIWDKLLVNAAVIRLTPYSGTQHIILDQPACSRRFEALALRTSHANCLRL